MANRDASSDDQFREARGSRSRVLIVVAVIGAVGVCLYGAISIGPNMMRDLGNITPASVENPPTYPGAQQIRAEELKVKEGWKGKHIVLRTPDPPEKIFQFYNDALARDGWVEDSSVPLGLPPATPAPRPLFGTQFQLQQ